MSMSDELEKLHKLREQGALNEEEFSQAKKRVLDGEPAAKAHAPRAKPEPSVLHEFKRSRTERWIGGVSGGLAELTNIPAWSWRILFFLTALLHGLGIILYILLWIFVPLEEIKPKALPAPKD